MGVRKLRRFTLGVNPRRCLLSASTKKSAVLAYIQSKFVRKKLDDDINDVIG